MQQCRLSRAGATIEQRAKGFRVEAIEVAGLNIRCGERNDLGTLAIVKLEERSLSAHRTRRVAERLAIQPQLLRVRA